MSEEHPPNDGLNHPEPGPDAPAAPGAPPSGAAAGGSDDRNMAMLAHLLGIFTGFLGALIIWLVKKDQSSFVDDQGKEALNFQITIMLAYAISAASLFIVIGCVLVPLVMVANIVLCILAAVAASKGTRYRYPFTLRLIK